MGAPYLRHGLLALLCACALLPAQPFAADPAPAPAQIPAAAARPKPKLPPLPDPVRVGTEAPDFELADTNGTVHRLSDYTAQGKIVVLEWFSPACPVCVAYYTPPAAAEGAAAGMAPMAAIHDALGEDVVWLCINSAAPGKPGSDPAENTQSLTDLSIHFPLLLDKSGRIGLRR